MEPKPKSSIRNVTLWVWEGNFVKAFLPQEPIRETQCGMVVKWTLPTGQHLIFSTSDSIKPGTVSLILEEEQSASLPIATQLTGSVWDWNPFLPGFRAYAISTKGSSFWAMQSSPHTKSPTWNSSNSSEVTVLLLKQHFASHVSLGIRP